MKKQGFPNSNVAQDKCERCGAKNATVDFIIPANLWLCETCFAKLKGKEK